MKKQWWVLFILLAVGLASVSTISARAPEDASAKNAFVVRVADLLSLDHDVVAEALTQAKQDIRQPALSNKLDATRIKLDNLVAAGKLTRAEADAKVTAISELPLKRHGKKHRGKGKGSSIGVEAKLEAMVAAGELTRAEADAKITAISEFPLKGHGKNHRGKGKGSSIGVEAKLEAMVLSGELSEAEAKAKFASFKSGRAKRSPVR